MLGDRGNRLFKQVGGRREPEKGGARHAAPLQLLRRLLHFLFEQFGDDLLDHLIGERADFFGCFGLDRMRDKNRFVLCHAQR